MELEPTRNVTPPPPDRRPLIPQPLPVKLVAVSDVRMLATAGREADLDKFYAAMLQFERESDSAGIVYRAENFRLIFDLVDGLPERDDLRPQQIEVLSLAEAEQKLIEAELEYVCQRGLIVGSDSLLLQDPAGNWVELLEMRRVV
jgi:hypothetical protein